MRVKIEFQSVFGKAGSLLLEEESSNSLSLNRREKLQYDLETVLKLFSGIILVTVEQATSDEENGEFIPDLIDTLERFIKAHFPEHAIVQES
jgi:hypothetical protein